MATILVVDDDADIRSLLRAILEVEGHYICDAADGVEALSLFDELHPDVVVLDVMMPGLSGLDVLAGIRARGNGRDVPVMLLTALRDEQTAWRGWVGGANTFVTKPFDPDYVVDWVVRQLQRTPEGV
jgi:DNA-binding response OmpR family regulator